MEVAQDYIVHATDTPGLFIFELANGRRILIEIDPVNGKETFIREL